MRTELSLKTGWRFTTKAQPGCAYDVYHLTKAGAQAGPAAMSYDDSGWRVVTLPHDYVVSGKLSPDRIDYTGYTNRENAWYRKYFYLKEEYKNHRILLCFGGVSGESSLYVNGCKVWMNHSSYLGFTVDISDFVRFGQEVNVLAVRLMHEQEEGWWYQGGGIFRSVRLILTSQVWIEPGEVRIGTVKNPNGTWVVEAEAGIASRNALSGEETAWITLRSPEEKDLCREQVSLYVEGRRTARISWKKQMQNPSLWDLFQGNLYQVTFEIRKQDQMVDQFTETFGFREMVFHAEDGFWLNGRRVEIRGFCYHEDEGNLGWAVTKETYEKRLRNLIAMGGNAYRCSHNPPDEQLLYLCDRYGVLVLDEVRRFETGQIGIQELQRMVRRDRNHPCIFLWSMGNEEPWQGMPCGARIMEHMREIVRDLDPTRPVTMAMHEGFLQEGAADYSDVVGINYNHELYEQVHERYPDKPMIGTENLSLADHFQDGTRRFTGSDLAYDTLYEVKRHPYISGTFGWAGQDYRGEHRNLSFFTNCSPTDCTGGRKDGFYQYAAYWRDDPVIHICGHWNDTGIKERTVTVYSNMEEVELLLNGTPVGKGSPDQRRRVVFSVAFQKGILIARGKSGGKTICNDSLKTTGQPVRLRLVPEKASLHADGAERLFISVFAEDEEGNIVPVAAQTLRVQVTGSARLICTDNPDPYSTWQDTAEEMSVFQGKGRIVLEAERTCDPVTVNVSSKMLAGDSCRIDVLPALCGIEECPGGDSPYVNEWFVSYVFDEAHRPDPCQWPTDDYYMHWRKYWEPATLVTNTLPFYRRHGYVICCQEMNLPAFVTGKTPALVFEKVGGEAEFLVSARDYNNQITKRVRLLKETAAPASVRIPLDCFYEGDRMIIKAVIHGCGYEDGIQGNVRFEL